VGADDRRLRWVLRAGLAALHACALAILVYAVMALMRSAYTEWVESAVAAIARRWASGGAIYPSVAPPEKYNVYPYGPLLFQMSGTIFAAFGGSNRAAKIAYAGLTVLTYLSMFCTLRRDRVGMRESALSVEFLAVFVGIMGFMAKADIMLVAVSVAACATVAFTRQHIVMGAGLAMLAGVAAATKIHGIFYVLPAAVEYLARRPTRIGAKIAVAASLAAFVAFAPFLIPRTSLPNYIFVLRIASQDGLLPGIFLSNMAFIGMCVAGVYVLTPAAARDAAFKRLLISVLVAGSIVSVFAAKAEAGPHHLIPLLPYLCLPLGRALGGYFDTRKALLFVLFLVSFQPLTSVTADVRLMLAHWNGRGPVI